MIDRVLRIETLLALDDGEDLATLHRRDRAIGTRRDVAGAHPAEQVLEWARARAEEVGSAGGALATFERTAAIVLVAGGLVLGAGAASGVLYYDGAGRVNVLSALALLVGVQALTVLATVVVMLPAGLRASVPGLAALQSALLVLSPSRLERLLARRAPQGVRERLERFVAATRAGDRVYGRLRRWTALLGGQVFAVAFNAGLVVAYLSAVVFTDLAFGWSTTLDVDPRAVHELARWLAAPWAALAPGAVPTLDLVEASRYFRADPRASVDAAALGGWWPFVLMCLLVYGALPRLLLLGVARARAHAAERWTLVHLPGAAELLYRLATDPVETRADEPETPGPQANPAAPAGHAVHGPATLVVWGDLDISPAEAAAALAGAAALEPVRTLGAGAGTLEEDGAVVREAAGASEPVALVVKSWEPPLGELVDFLGDLRAALGEARPVCVVPVAATPSTAPDAQDLATWRDRLARIDDPWLAVRGITR